MRVDNTSDIRKLLEENIKLSKAILRSAEKTRKYMRWAKIMSIVRLVIIVIPIVLALLYIPPFLQNINETFGELYNLDQLNILNQIKSGILK